MIDCSKTFGCVGRRPFCRSPAKPPANDGGGTSATYLEARPRDHKESRAEIIARYGSVQAALEPCEWEVLL